MDDPVPPVVPPKKKRKKRPQYPKTVKSRYSLITDPKHPMPPGHGELASRRLSKATREAALVTMLRQIERGRQPTQAVRALATRYGCHEAAMWRVLGPYRRPTTKAATWHLRVSAYDMAKRVVKEGSPAELIDVLSRPNIGVLEPAKKVGGDAGSGLFISVQIGSCGGVSGSVTAQAVEALNGEVLDQGAGGEESGQGIGNGAGAGRSADDDEPRIA